MKKFNYENKVYLEKLDDLDKNYYQKYIEYIGLMSGNMKAKILDVGCGNGRVLKSLINAGFDSVYGIDISKLFIVQAKKNGIKNAYAYDGLVIPFKDSFFDIIGSFNVLEHTEEPEFFLEQQLLKLKQKGYLIVACPNFYTPILKTGHRRIKGMKNRTKNAFRILSKSLYLGDTCFERIPPVINEKFEYDDDSIVVTNPIELRKILVSRNCKIIYESGFINHESRISRFIDRFPIFRYMMPSCFVIAQKL